MRGKKNLYDLHVINNNIPIDLHYFQQFPSKLTTVLTKDVMEWITKRLININNSMLPLGNPLSHLHIAFYISTRQKCFSFLFLFPNGYLHHVTCLLFELWRKIQRDNEWHEISLTLFLEQEHVKRKLMDWNRVMSCDNYWKRGVLIELLSMNR